MIFILDRKITPDEFEKAKEAYSDYIKTVMDIRRKVLAVGGIYHIDCEEALLQDGSFQEDLYGGGFRPSTGDIEYMALSNIKPALNRTTYEITDNEIRQLLNKLTLDYLKL